MSYLPKYTNTGAMIRLGGRATGIVVVAFLSHWLSHEASSPAFFQRPAAISELALAGETLTVVGSRIGALGTDGTDLLLSTPLRVVDIDGPDSRVARIIGQSDLLPFPAKRIRATEAVAALEIDGMYIALLDRLDPTNLSIRSTETSIGRAAFNSVAVAGTHFLFLHDSGFYTIEPGVGADARVVGNYSGSVPGRYLDIDVSESTAFATVFAGDNASGLEIIDISNLARPRHLAFLKTPSVPMAIVASIDYVYVYSAGFDDTAPRQLSVIDIRNKRNPRFAGRVVLEPGGSALTSVTSLSKQPDQSQQYPYQLRAKAQLAARNGIVYITIPGRGLTIVDAQDPAVAHVSAVRPDLGLRELTLVGDKLYADQRLSTGYAIGEMELSNPIAPEIEQQLLFPDIADTPRSLLVRDQLLYAIYLRELRLFDISDPSAPVTLGRSDLPSGCCGLEINLDAGMLLAPTVGGMALFNVADPSQPEFMDQYSGALSSADVVVVAGYPAIAKKDQGLELLDLTSTPRFNVLSRLRLPFVATRLVARGQTVYAIGMKELANQEDITELAQVDYSDLMHPRVESTIEIGTGHPLTAWKRDENLVIILAEETPGVWAPGSTKVYVYDLMSDMSPRLTSTSTTGNNITIEQVMPGERFVAAWGTCFGGLHPSTTVNCSALFDFRDPTDPLQLDVKGLTVNAVGDAFSESGGVIYTTLRDQGIHVYSMPSGVFPTPTARPDENPTEVAGVTPTDTPTVTPRPTRRVPLPRMIVITPASVAHRVYVPWAEKQ